MNKMSRKTTRVIAASSGKGGATKTTTLLAAATEYRRRGETVLLLDCDPNNHLAEWAERRGDEGLVVVSNVTEANIRETIRAMAPDFDVVLIDLAGFNSVCMLYAFSLSDLVITPTQTGAFDVAETIKTYGAIRDTIGRLTHTPESRILLARTRSTIRAKVDAHAEGMLSELGVPVMRVQMIDRVIFREMTYFAQGPCELDPGSNADLNVRALVDEIEDILGGCAANPNVPRKSAA